MLDAVVVNYRTPEDLEGFIASWKAFAPEWANLTIVNVSPTERDIEVAQAGVEMLTCDLTGVTFNGVELDLVTAAGFSHPRHVIYEDNVGYSWACNKGVTGSSADVFAFFNADTRILDGSIEPLYANLMLHDDWGVIGPRQVNDDGRLTHAGILGTNQKPELRGWMRPDSPAFCDVRDDAVSVMGSAYFVKAECWHELTNCATYRAQHPDAAGAFLPTKHYYEETWCSYHARAHDWKVVYYGLSKMVHRWHKASPVGGFADALFSESREIFRSMCDAHGIERD